RIPSRRPKCDRNTSTEKQAHDGDDGSVVGTAALAANSRPGVTGSVRRGPALGSRLVGSRASAGRVTTSQARIVPVLARLACFIPFLRGVSVAQHPGPPSASVPTAEVTPAKRITAYTLSPDLYRKAHFLGRLRFATRILGVLYGVFVPWLILQRLWSAK